MRLASLLVVCLLLAGCSGGSPDHDPDLDPQGPGASSLDDQASQAAATPPKPVKTQAVQDTVSFSGTLGASACWFDGSQVSCANVGGNNVLVYVHERKANLTGGQLKVSFTPGTGSGPYATAFVAEDCPGTCRLVTELADNRPDLAPSGPSGTFDLELPAATILGNQTLVVRIAPLLLSSLASASPTYDIDLTGTLDLVVPA